MKTITARLGLIAALCCLSFSPVLAAESAAAATTTAPVAAAKAAPVAKVKECKKGKPCGNTCIGIKATCTAKDATPAAKPVKAASAKAAMPSSDTATSPTSRTSKTASKATGEKKAKTCTKGKPCGNGCIPMDKTCHIQ